MYSVYYHDTQNNIQRILLENLKDVNEIPVNSLGTLSTALAVKAKKAYILDHKRNWCEITYETLKKLESQDNPKYQTNREVCL